MPEVRQPVAFPPLPAAEVHRPVFRSVRPLGRPAAQVRREVAEPPAHAGREDGHAAPFWGAYVKDRLRHFADF